MNQNFITINGLKIAYFEKNPTADKMIFFIHGNSCSSRMWAKQLHSELLTNYRLIAFDLPGHGKSSASENPLEDYSPIGTAKILSSAVSKLAGKAPCILVGFSYGTNLVAEMLEYDVAPLGIVLMGACVIGQNFGLEKAFAQRTTPSIFSYNETEVGLVESFFLESMNAGNEKDLQNAIEDYLSANPVFKPTIFRTAGEGKITDEIQNLKNLGIPVCLIFGKTDRLVNIDYLDESPFSIWTNSVYKLPGAGHWVNIDDAAKVNQLISDYADEMFKATHV